MDPKDEHHPAFCIVSNADVTILPTLGLLGSCKFANNDAMYMSVYVCFGELL